MLRVGSAHRICSHLLHSWMQKLRVLRARFSRAQLAGEASWCRERPPRRPASRPRRRESRRNSKIMLTINDVLSVSRQASSSQVKERISPLLCRGECNHADPSQLEVGRIDDADADASASSSECCSYGGVCWSGGSKLSLGRASEAWVSATDEDDGDGDDEYEPVCLSEKNDWSNSSDDGEVLGSSKEACFSLSVCTSMCHGSEHCRMEPWKQRCNRTEDRICRDSELLFTKRYHQRKCLNMQRFRITDSSPFLHEDVSSLQAASGGLSSEETLPPEVCCCIVADNTTKSDAITTKGLHQCSSSSFCHNHVREIPHIQAENQANRKIGHVQELLCMEEADDEAQRMNNHARDVSCVEANDEEANRTNCHVEEVLNIAEADDEANRVKCYVQKVLNTAVQEGGEAANETNCHVEDEVLNIVLQVEKDETIYDRQTDEGKEKVKMKGHVQIMDEVGMNWHEAAGSGIKELKGYQNKECIDHLCRLESQSGFTGEAGEHSFFENVERKKTKKKTGLRQRDVLSISADFPADLNSGIVQESIAFVKLSDNPDQDFRQSIHEMIVQKNVSQISDVQDLLYCYLSLNSPQHHHLIEEAFVDVFSSLLICHDNSTF